MRSISPQTAGYMVFPEQHLKGHFNTPNGVWVNVNYYSYFTKQNLLVFTGIAAFLNNNNCA